MEIRIRTAEEFHDAHVTIEIRADDQDEAGEVAKRLLDHSGCSGAIEGLQDRASDLEAALSTAQQAREIETRRAQGLEQELERYRRAHVCTDRCTENAHVAMEGRSLVADLETALAEARAEGKRFREEMERRFTTVQVADAKEGARADERARLDREVIKPINTKLSRIHSAVLGTELARELAEYREASAATLLVEALAEVRRITGVTSV